MPPATVIENVVDWLKCLLSNYTARELADKKEGKLRR
jgi:hypothetical protein